jgi:hypothetical protein
LRNRSTNVDATCLADRHHFDVLKRSFLAIRIPDEVKRDVRALARSRRDSLNETVRKALNTELLLVDEVRRGGKVIVRERDGAEKQIVLLGGSRHGRSQLQ